MDRERGKIERRMHPRFRAAEHAVALCEDDYGQIIDISAGGLSFYSVLNPGQTDDQVKKLSIVFPADGFHLEKMPIIFIPDNTRCQPHGQELTAPSRRSVRFGELTPVQQAQLEYFLEHITAGGA